MRSKNTIIFLIVAIVSFLVYWFFIRKKTVKTPAPTPSSTETPSATMGEAVVTFKPDKDGDEPEAYTEYAAGDTDWADLSKNVTVKLTWDNKAGFNNTTKITIKRVIIYKTETKTYNHVIDRYNAEGNVIAGNKDYFKNFESGLSYTVTNKSGNGDTAYSVLGENTYSILYTLNTDPSITGVLTEDDDGDKTTLTDTFSIDDLSLTLDMLEKTERKVKPSGAGGVETSSSASENLVYLLSKNKAYGYNTGQGKSPKRIAYRDSKWVSSAIPNKITYTRLDKVMKQICNKKKGYETTDKNAFQLYNINKEKHLAAKFTYETNDGPTKGDFKGVELTYVNTDTINQACVDGSFCTTFKMVEDQYTKGDTGDTTKYYAFRVSDCNRKTRKPWNNMDATERANPDNTRGTDELKSTVDAYLVANTISGRLTLKTLDQMTDTELGKGWHAFEMRNVDSGTAKEISDNYNAYDFY